MKTFVLSNRYAHALFAHLFVFSTFSFFAIDLFSFFFIVLSIEGTGKHRSPRRIDPIKREEWGTEGWTDSKKNSKKFWSVPSYNI